MKVYPQKTYGELTEILPIIRDKRRERFLAKIDRTWVWPHGCHLWTGHTNQLEYGLVQGCVHYRGYSFLAHRVAWALKHRREPGEAVIRHSCDLRLCCNEDHLLSGTQQDVIDDMRASGRANFSGGTGRPFDEAGFEEAVRLRFEERWPIADVAAKLGRHRSTILRWLAIHVQLG
jgi:hypothetical protein